LKLVSRFSCRLCRPLEPGEHLADLESGSGKELRSVLRIGFKCLDRPSCERLVLCRWQVVQQHFPIQRMHEFIRNYQTLMLEF
jgi:hypothetical protein